MFSVRTHKDNLPCDIQRCHTLLLLLLLILLSSLLLQKTWRLMSSASKHEWWYHPMMSRNHLQTLNHFKPSNQMHRKMVTSWSYLVITIVTFFSFLPSKKHSSHFCACKDCLLSGEEVRNPPQGDALSTPANVVCVYLFVNTYTQNTATCTKTKALWYTFFGQKKDKYNKKKTHPIKVSFISILFFLWIYGISDTVIMGFVHLICNTTTQC